MPEIKGGQRERILRRAQWTCEYCRVMERYSPDPLSVEHIVPQSKGGDGSYENLAASCQGCNNHKYQKTEASDPQTGGAVPLFHPRRQRWRDHFAWSLDSTRIVGITPIGRATVELFRLNRVGLVNLRKVLHKEGVHPPPEIDEIREPRVPND